MSNTNQMDEKDSHKHAGSSQSGGSQSGSHQKSGGSSHGGNLSQTGGKSGSGSNDDAGRPTSGQRSGKRQSGNYTDDSDKAGDEDRKGGKL